jgi:ketosteroid isomerase-like protein
MTFIDMYDESPVLRHRDVTVGRRREEMVRSLLAAVDGGDVGAVAASFSPDARQRFGNRPWMYGRPEIEAAYVAFASTVDGMRNEVTGIWESAGTVIVRLEFHCERLDGSVVEVPAVCMFSEGPDGLIDVFQIWSDWTPLFATVPWAATRP